jgi:transcriptional regulator with XRE-family HTH domain
MESRGRQLQKLRELAGLTQFEVARAAGVHRGTLSAIENGHIEATQEQVTAIREACTNAARKAMNEIGALVSARSA